MGWIGFINDFIEWAKGEFTKVWDAFWKWAADISEKVETAIRGLIDFFGEQLAKLKGWAANEFTKFLLWAGGEFKKFTDWVGGEFKKFTDWATGEFGKFEKWVGSEFTKFINWAEVQYSKFEGWATSELDKLKGWAAGEWDKFRTWSAGEFNKFKEAIRGGSAWFAEGMWKVIEGWADTFAAGLERGFDDALREEGVDKELK